MDPFRWVCYQPSADGRFSTEDGRARLVPITQKPLPDPLTKWPLTLNTGRYRDQWHTMTRTGLAPKLARHREEPLVEIHPDDGSRLGLTDGRSEEHTSELQSLMRISYAVFCLKKKNNITTLKIYTQPAQNRTTIHKHQ